MKTYAGNGAVLCVSAESASYKGFFSVIERGLHKRISVHPCPNDICLLLSSCPNGIKKKFGSSVLATLLKGIRPIRNNLYTQS